MATLGIYTILSNLEGSSEDEKIYAASQEEFCRQTLCTEIDSFQQGVDHTRRMIIYVEEGLPIEKIISCRDDANDLLDRHLFAKNEYFKQLDFIQHDDFYVIEGDGTNMMKLQFEPLSTRLMMVSTLGIFTQMRGPLNDRLMHPRISDSGYQWGTLKNKNRPAILPEIIPHDIKNHGTPMEDSKLEDCVEQSTSLIRDLANLCVSYERIPYKINPIGHLQNYDYKVWERVPLGSTINIIQQCKIDGVVTIPTNDDGSTFTFADEEKVGCELAISLYNLNNSIKDDNFWKCGGAIYGMPFPKPTDLLYYCYMFSCNNNFDVYDVSADKKFIDTSLNNLNNSYENIDICLSARGVSCAPSYTIICLQQHKD